MTTKGFGTVILGVLLGGLLFGGLLTYKTHEMVTAAGHSFGIVAKGIARANQAQASASLPSQSIDIAVEGNRIVRIDNKPQVWPTVVRSTKGDRGVMLDSEAAGDNADAEEAASKRVLAQGK